MFEKSKGGMGKLKRETICLQYTHFSVHSITHQNANIQWAGNIQKLGLQKDREKDTEEIKYFFPDFSYKFCQLMLTTHLCAPPNTLRL